MILDPVDAFLAAQQWLFESLVQPLLFHGGLGNLLEVGYRATGWLLVGLLQIAVMLLVLGALERWRPAEPVTDRASVHVDVIYTLIHRLGFFRLVLFFTLDPLWDLLVGKLRLAGLAAYSIDDLWPGITDQALLSFVIYLLLFDAVDYLLHRAQHGWGWWWQLHSLHHSQRQMTMWSDNRNHLLDDVLRDSVFVLVALLVGVPPGQFIAVVACTQLLESLAHANLQLSFGPLLGRLLVSPAYHRVHHAMFGAGATATRVGAGSHNFAVLFPLWDMLGRTARFDAPLGPTGLSDQLEGVDYGRGFWAQQRLGLLRLARALVPGYPRHPR